VRGAASGLAAALAVAALVAGCGSSGSGGADSTLHATWGDPHQSGVLERAKGEPFVDRTVLAPRSKPVKQLALFAQFTDAHVRDEESPARVPFLDRYGGAFSSTFRPQEALSPQVLVATVRAIDALHPQAVVETGDLIDNDQQNELDQALAVLRSGRVDPDSGARGYSGVQSASDADPLFYRPDVDAPRHPGLLAAAERPFHSPGLDAPWYPVVGNHDLLVQGEVPPTPALDAVATGSRRVVSLPSYVRPSSVDEGSAPQEVASLLAGGLPGRTVHTAPDPRRRLLQPAQLLERLRAASRAGGSGPLLDYSFNIGPSVRAIVLDTVSRVQGSGGVFTTAQAAWLRAQLAAAGQRYVVVFSHQSLTSFPQGAGALALLDRDPHVVAAIAGNSHKSRIEPRRSAAGGYWLITTSSLADYPQQARAFRLVRTADGRVALETWMIDHDNGNMAGISRELSYLDVQGGRPNGFAGTPLDRNARLYR
jgi:metallophosphoesterase (TIGR03767 family)